MRPLASCIDCAICQRSAAMSSQPSARSAALNSSRLTARLRLIEVVSGGSAGADAAHPASASAASPPRHALLLLERDGAALSIPLPPAPEADADRAVAGQHDRIRAHP